MQLTTAKECARQISELPDDDFAVLQASTCRVCISTEESVVIQLQTLLEELTCGDGEGGVATTELHGDNAIELHGDRSPNHSYNQCDEKQTTSGDILNDPPHAQDNTIQPQCIAVDSTTPSVQCIAVDNTTPSVQCTAVDSTTPSVQYNTTVCIEGHSENIDVNNTIRGGYTIVRRRRNKQSSNSPPNVSQSPSSRGGARVRARGRGRHKDNYERQQNYSRQQGYRHDYTTGRYGTKKRCKGRGSTTECVSYNHSEVVSFLLQGEE